jgi:hypothetical protein
MSETLSAEDPGGQISQNKTIYVQGNKEKIERESTSEITDLDKGLIYILDKHRRLYAQILLAVVRSCGTGRLRQFSPKTGKPES